MGKEDMLSIQQRYLDTIAAFSDTLKVKDKQIASAHGQIHNISIDRLPVQKQRQQLKSPEYVEDSTYSTSNDEEIRCGFFHSTARY